MKLKLSALLLFSKMTLGLDKDQRCDSDFFNRSPIIKCPPVISSVEELKERAEVYYHYKEYYRICREYEKADEQREKLAIEYAESCEKLKKYKEDKICAWNDVIPTVINARKNILDMLVWASGEEGLYCSDRGSFSSLSNEKKESLIDEIIDLAKLAEWISDNDYRVIKTLPPVAPKNSM